MKHRHHHRRDSGGWTVRVFVSEAHRFRASNQGSQHLVQTTVGFSKPRLVDQPPQPKAVTSIRLTCQDAYSWRQVYPDSRACKMFCVS